ncbi:MAG: heme ABC transporter ATP-binding protein [Rhodospirillaceae bacterium]|nr:heme ABC transporter ATP-binding protein [Rhodospirillaceae bacterium]|tara:strand:+ start:5488 stop:7029 length:1542 start_codon:yes stop_codon:yes gene_type:complete
MINPATANSKNIILELKNIDKWFGHVHANQDVSIQIENSTIHGIIGENGAGKSTLMSIVYGYYQADKGSIFVNGKEVFISSPVQALNYGIGMVHQHFKLVEPFTVLENIILGAETGTILENSLQSARKELKRLEDDYSLNVNPDSVVGELPVGIRQRVEILKALYRGANIFILDEPTGVLTPQEVDHLFKILKSLKKQGKTIILITHKLREIMDLTDNVTVMRQGRVINNKPTKKTNKEELAELMVGRSVLLSVNKKDKKIGRKILSVNNLSIIDEKNIEKVKNISFDIHEGEIIGIAGVAGNGQTELLETLTGIRRINDGTIKFHNKTFDNSNPINAKEIRKNGLAHVPEDRQRMGLVTSFSANESGILGYQDLNIYKGKIFLKKYAILKDMYDKFKRFDVRPANPILKTSSFSGGNQQKIVLVREMDQEPELLIVGQPTRGVDIGAIEFIHKQLIELRNKGKAILLVSVELDEVLSLSDKILVMFDGKIVGKINQKDADEKTLGLLMAGAK